MQFNAMFHGELCCVMQQSVGFMLRYAALCDVMMCHGLSFHAILRFIMSCHTVLCYTMFCYVIFYLVYAKLCYIVLLYFMVMWGHVLAFHGTLYFFEFVAPHWITIYSVITNLDLLNYTAKLYDGPLH